MIAFLSGLLFFLFAADQTGVVSPYVWNDLLLGSAPPPCFGAIPVRDSFKMEDKGRASGFSLRGTTVCEHLLFEPNERDPFYNFVVQQSGLQAKTVAQNLYDQYREAGDLRLPIQLNIKAANPRVESIVRASFDDELFNLFGPGSVARLAARTQLDDSAAHITPTEISIVVQRGDAPDLLFEITLNYSDAQGLRHQRHL